MSLECAIQGKTVHGIDGGVNGMDQRTSKLQDADVIREKRRLGLVTSEQKLSQAAL